MTEVSQALDDAYVKLSIAEDAASALRVENLQLREKVAALEARIRELTEWRPASATPKDGTLIVAEREDGGFIVLELANESPEEWAWNDSEDGPFYGPEEILRFIPLPLPSTEGGES